MQRFAISGKGALDVLLLVDSTDVFSLSDLDLGKCIIIKHAIKITDPQPFKEKIQKDPTSPL